ncbi:hypothetical protein CONCODRAFT_21027 [Conidiobolus coronatus NRRL 28638]|uniref:F-box domain-containing protein n=1 Tax=Conidiobolus coronatus (strain ATCC 28846 / CBS 209.66 / NRRL 28638) TaxID=796925 RepID=A0A137NPQ2_CONC2|nr:hypothetical protein CONCODRAFT_21027 [Conidiobolus coronatus NRRL 28638]|eukprot:KXN64717.1 hypothetical protein CONCODRAFT_21027 [Conidiobolus coronatus NRRL 28638]
MTSISENDLKIIVLTNPELLKYLEFSTKLALSQVSSQIRLSLLPQVFNNSVLNRFILEKLPNYFNTPTSLNFNKFKVQIDPFIDESINTLKPIAKYFTTVEFYLMEFSSYFMVPILDNFINLKELSFVDLLNKLEKLEILDMKDINLIMDNSEDPNLANNLQFPKSLNYLNFQFVHLEISNLTKIMPLKSIQNPQHNYFGQILLPKPQILPNLIELKIFDRNDGIKIMEEFKALNPNLKITNDALRYGLANQ